MTVESEKYSLRWQNTEFELTMACKFLNMQLKIDLLRKQVNKLKDENVRFKDMINGQNVRRRNEIKNSNLMIYSNIDLFIIEYISL